MKRRSQKDNFTAAIKKGYPTGNDTFTLGTAVFANKPIEKLPITAFLAMMNRHGLIAGATGTGKTRTLQRIAEELSKQGCSVLLMDIKGDVSGIAEPGTPSKKIAERQKQIGLPWKPRAFPVEFLSISNEKGTRMRATVSEFGPLLFSRILDVNETQAGVIALLFKYCDDQHLPLLDLKDFKKALQFLTNEGKDDIKKDYGTISSASASTILRKVIELEEQGGDLFFGEKSFDVEDLLRKTSKGEGYINILRLTDMQNRPKLFSTFMLCLLAEVYGKFPEEGDIAKPKLIIFIDEAHLVFDDAPKVLLNQIETVVKLIRSKGVGVYFCTQNPVDIPSAILGQLGMKIQHALRAFTARDRKAIKLTAENYPETKFYDVDELLTSLGTGEALVTVLNEKGVPTPLADTLLCAPESSMDTITDAELAAKVKASELAAKYNKTIERESAYEMLEAKMEKSISSDEKTPARKTAKAKKSVVEQIARSPMARQVGRTVAREITRGLLGILTGKK
jgi:DNA helicase HerA-like ATPase